MDSFNIFHLLILAGLVVPPVLGWRVAKKLGYHGAWGLLAWAFCFPWAGVLVLAALAFLKLPFERPARLAPSRPLASKPEILWRCIKAMPSLTKAPKAAPGGAGQRPPAGLARSSSLAACTALLFYGLSLAALAGAADPLTNPDAVKHRIDRSAMEIQIQGWSRDLKFPVYPIKVQAGATGVYYTTNENARDYKEFYFEELRCEIGDADPAVRKLPGYSCADGVCMTPEGAVLGTDPRRRSRGKALC